MLRYKHLKNESLVEMTSWHLKLSDWIFLIAGFSILASIPLIHMFGFPLWVAARVVYGAGIISLLIRIRKS